jgi:zinc protease
VTLFTSRASARSVIGLAAGTLICLATPAAQAMTIERVISPGGIEAWLVHDSAVPVVALEFAMPGGASQDPADKPGVANMVASTIDEGSGPLDAAAFHDKVERKAIELSFRASRDYFRGTMRTLTENRDEAFDCLRLSLTEPRFDTEAVERIRAQLISRVQRESMNPTDMANQNWWATAFPGHPYGQPVDGTLDSLSRITVDDLRFYTHHVLARDHLKIAVVGDIDAETTGRLIDRTFGGLPAKGELKPVPAIVPQGVGRKIVIKLDVPQAVVNFGAPGIARSDPDFMAAYIINHILGGGSFSSRLYREVREKRGLAYGVSDTLIWLDHTALLLGSTATRADATGQTIDIIEHEIRRLADDGPTEEELATSKTYLKGAFALGLDTSNRIASQLVQMQIDNLGIDYIERRGDLIDRVTMADAKRVAKRLLDGGMLVTVVGRPEGVVSTGGGEIAASPDHGAKVEHAPAPPSR